VVIIACWFIIAREFVTAAIIIVFSLFVDVIDGAVARHTGQVTKSGGFLDTIIDRYVEGLIIFGLVWIELPGFIVDTRIWLFVYFFGSFMTTYVKASAKEKELLDKELIGGFLGRAERMILLVIGFLLAPVNPQYLVYIIAVLAILSNLSVFHRIWLAVKHSDNR
jgi:phosphatidylglycerophosphate synthase